MNVALRHPVQATRRRFRQWWQARIPLRDSQVLTQRNVYILPTRPGLMLAATLLVLLVASINYQLNLGYVLTFLLAGCTAVGMHVCHNTLRGLTLSLMPPAPQFAGTSATLSVTLVNARSSVRHGIGLSLLDEDRWSWSDVPAQGTAVVHVAFQPVARGLQPVPAITAETRFPMGTFRVWTVWRPASRVLVYPAPEVHPPPLPGGEPRSGGVVQQRSRQPSGEFDGVRSYRRGDPLKLVVWKKAAKSDELVSRDAEQVQRHELWLDAAMCGAPTREAQLSRLCAWVLLADKNGLDYGLRLYGQLIPPSNGEAHKRHCLETLAIV